jgi:signal transduction histidine kinase
LPVYNETSEQRRSALNESTRPENTYEEEIQILRASVEDLEQQLQGERERAQAHEQSLIEANRHMDEFLSIVSHELRTPLTSINGNIQLAKRRLNALIIRDGFSEEILETLDLIQELLSRAENQVRIQNRLVSDLLDASRVQSGKLELHMEIIDLRKIIQNTVEDYRSTNPLRTITLTLPPEESILIFGDADRINQVINNYLSNALKYSASTQPVDVQCEIREDMVYVRVKDNGPGISAEVLPLVWQRFYRVPGIKAQNGAGAGLGIGLYICKVIIELHQGSVGVESLPGEGSIFWFALPIQHLQ